MRPLARIPGAVALLALLSLSACATYNPAYGGLPFPLPGDDGYYGRDGRYGDYNRTSEWRRVDGDAARFANQVDRAIGLSSSEERSVARVVRDRARQLLQRTHPRDHREVYPFPRGYRNDRFWDATDRAVERVLSSQNRREYRAWARGDYYNRDGYYDRHRDDDRYRDDDYRGRRYEERDRDGRQGARNAVVRDPLAILRGRQNEATRREEARREETRRHEEARRRQVEEQRREQARREETRRREEARRRQADAQRREQAQREDRRPQDDARRQAPQRRDSDRGREARDDDRRENQGRGSDRDEESRDDRDENRSADRRTRPQRGN